MVDKMSFLDLFVASFLVAIATAAPPAGDKVAKRDPTVDTFHITLYGLSGIEKDPSWTFTADNTKKSKEIESHLLHEGGHGKEHGAHDGGHPNHASPNKPKLSVKSGYFGMVIQHFGPGFEGAHEIVLSRCDNPALEYNLIRYTVPKSLDKDLTTKRKTYIYNVLLACANEQKAKKRRGNKVILCNCGSIKFVENLMKNGSLNFKLLPKRTDIPTIHIHTEDFVVFKEF